MSTPNRFSLRDAGKATFYNLQTGKAITTLPDLKTSGIETTGDTTYAQGGYGNVRLVGFSSNRQARLPIQDALFEKNSLAMLTGNPLVEAAKIIDFNEVKTTTSQILNLSKTPQGAIVSVFKVNTDGTNGQEYTLGTPASNALEYSVSGKNLTFNTAVANGTSFRVYYKVQTASDAKTIKVSANAFGSTFKVVVDIIVKDAADGLDYAGQIIVPRAHIENNFTISLSADGDPAALDIPIECLKDPVTGDMWQMVIYNADDIV
ncbi:hypothetical protein V7128_01270 [Neobacillus vireti]|uniref:hypothetical protein n=1 Tax=Neobacillus vireti TaxID=220686 RepID=UPI002FFFC8DC